MIRGIVLASLLLLSGQYNPAGPVFRHTIPLNPCLVSAWPMNEGSGTTFNDTAGTNNATVNNIANITWQHNVVGGGLYTSFPGLTPKWNGSGVANTTSTTVNNFDGSTPFSVSMWMSYPGAAADQAIMTNINPSSPFTGWFFLKHWTGVALIGRLGFSLINNSVSNAIGVTQSTNLTDNDIHYVVATYDGSKTAAGVVLYVDGASVATTVTANTLTGSSASSVPTSIGAISTGASPAANNAVTADGEIYNCVLTPTQIATYYAAGPGIY